MRQHRRDVQWHEYNAALPAWVLAETNRDRKRQRKPWSLWQWTLTGLSSGRRRRKRQRSQPQDTDKQQQLRARLDGVMKAFGGKEAGDGNSSR